MYAMQRGQTREADGSKRQAPTAGPGVYTTARRWEFAQRRVGRQLDEGIAERVAAPRPGGDWLLRGPGGKSSGLHGLPTEPPLSTEAQWESARRHTNLGTLSFKCLAEGVFEEMRVTSRRRTRWTQFHPQGDDSVSANSVFISSASEGASRSSHALKLDTTTTGVARRTCSPLTLHYSRNYPSDCGRAQRLL